MKRRYDANPARAIEYVKKGQLKLKIEVLTHYSTKPYPVCANPFHKHLPNDPFLTNIWSLTIDHINNDGAEERRRIGRKFGYAFYSWLKKHNYPEGYQDLCMNCQFQKRHESNLHKGS